MRRALVVLLACLGLTGVGIARAGESIDSGPWEGSALNAGATAITDFNAISLSGSFTRTPHRPFDVEVRATKVEGSPGCSVQGSGRFDPEPPTSPTEGFTFDQMLIVPCNGTYLAEAVARTTENAPDPPGPVESPAPLEVVSLDRTVSVVVPPPDVFGVNAVVRADRTVRVTWSPVSPRPPDLVGYSIERRSADGTVTEALAGEDATSFVDKAPPAAGGKTTYSVFALRPGATMSSNVRSPSPGSKAVTLSAAPASSGGDTDGDTGGSGGTGGTTTGGGTGSGGSGGTPTGAINTGGRPSGSITVPRVGTPSRNFFPPLLAPPVDTGFDTELPFEDREPGDEEAILPDDLASNALPGRGLVVPVATGLVLAVWGLHLRFLVRASNPDHLEDDSIEILRL